MTDAQLAEALTTKVGGRITDTSKAKNKAARGKATHEANSRSGMTLAAHVWGAGDDTRAQEKVMPTLEENKVQESLVAARASQRRETEGPLTTQQMDEMGQISSDTECSVDDIKKWLAEIRERIGPDNRNKS